MLEQSTKKILEIEIFWGHEVLKLQGQPLGFDTKYLALGDRNMQIRFSLKVVWEAWVLEIWCMYDLVKSNIPALHSLQKKSIQ